jgi:hypothetical protein
MLQRIARIGPRGSTEAMSLAVLMGVAALSLLLSQPALAQTSSSPFLTGATALESNILAWLTPIAIILVMVLGAMAMANRIAQVSSTYGKGEAQTIVENCSNTLILRCSASEHGGTSQFASRLIGQREVVHIARSESRRPSDVRPSITESEHRQIEPAVMDSEIERLPDLAGFLKLASSPDWLRVSLRVPERLEAASPSMQSTASAEAARVAATASASGPSAGSTNGPESGAVSSGQEYGMRVEGELEHD